MPSSTGIGSETQANYLFEQLVGSANATLPEVDLFDDTHTIPWNEDSAVFAAVAKPTVEELVSQFHAIMAGVGEELKKEHDAGRITGAKYADAYLALTQSALGGAVQFALGKDQAFWMAAKTQADAISSHNQNEVIRLEAMLRRATYALTKLKLSESDSAFGTSEYQRLTVLPAQKLLLSEQAEAQRAQTMDTRLTNGAGDAGDTVAGLLGAQKALYAQQKQSYVDDTRIKACKIFSDLWITMRTIDEGTITPQEFRPGTEAGGVITYNTELGAMYAAMRATATGAGT